MSRIIGTAAAAAALLFIIPGALAQSIEAPLMALSGTPSTDVTGAAIYTIPLQAPPGTVEPTLRLTYTSGQPGRAYLGPGWSILGQPVIRCRNAPKQFCIGQIVLVNATGKYGEDGTKYRAREDHFERFLSHGTRDGGPEWLEHTNKQGTETDDYGMSPDARKLGPDGKVRAWHVSRFRDAAGNYMTYGYRPHAGGVPYPERMDYTGNERGKLKPFSSVRFSYDKQDGGEERVTHIRTYFQDRLVSDYRFDYVRDPEAATALLSKIRRCDSSGACLAATTIRWKTTHIGTRAVPVVSEVENGAGNLVWFDYKPPPPLPDKSAPLLKAAYPDLILSSMAYTDGQGGQRHSSYVYSGRPLLVPQAGYFFGFTESRTTDQENGMVWTCLRSSDPDTEGAVVSSITALGPVELTATHTVWGHRPTVKGATFLVPSQTVTITKDPDGAPLSTITERKQFDAFGNETKVTQSRDDGWSKTSIQTFSNDTAHWYLGRMTRNDTVYKNANGELHRSSSYRYDPQTGLMAQEVVEPDAPQYRLQTDYLFDSFGHRVRQTVSGAGIAQREAISLYDDKGLFNLRQQLDFAFEKPMITDKGGKIQRDGFGRTIGEDGPGWKMTARYAYCKTVQPDGETCPVPATTLVEASYAGANPYKVTTYFGATGLYLGALLTNNSRQIPLEHREYDRNGRLTRNCAQPPNVPKPACTGYRYNAIGRVIASTDAQGHETSWQYRGWSGTSTDANGVTVTIVTDPDQKTVKTVQGNLTMTYTRDPLGFDTAIHASDGRWIEKRYDPRGILVHYRSGSGGKETLSVQRKFNVLNELLSETDAAGKVRSFEPTPGHVDALPPNTEYDPAKNTP